MDETEQSGGADASQQGDLSQADIDAMLGDGADMAGDDANTGQDAPAEEQAAESAQAADSTISQADIDALMSGGAGSEASSEAPAEDGDSGAVTQEDIDALVSAAQTGDEAVGGEDAQASEETEAGSEPDTRVDTLGRPFDEAAAAMEAAIAEERTAAQAAAATAPSQAFELQEFADEQLGDIDTKRVTMLNDVDLRVKLQLGETKMLVEDVLKLGEGSVVELDKLAGDPIDVLINDRLIARGEVLVLNDVFCVRVSEVLSHDPHRVTT
ncbi:MAG: flagellar motor switch protein FliN [Phycisphaerales bacterium]|nr:MAG: flagellar motor switch protein FliN [Phycisphaerales bacterium]